MDAVPSCSSFRCALIALVALVGTDCVTSRALTEGELRDFSTREYSAAWDEVYDATWLALEREGYTVTTFDRPAGTLTATKDARAYAVEVSSHGSRQRVVAAPSAKGTLDAAEEAAHLERIEDITRELLDTWRDVPEWSFDARRNSILIDTFKVSPPLEWEHLDLSVDRRRVVVQRKKNQRSGLNPTLIVTVDRRRPSVPVAQLVQDAAGLALSARARLTFPDESRARLDETGYSAAVRVMDGSTPRDLRWFAWDVRSNAWSVRVVAVCGPDASESACAGEWRKVARSVVSEGFSFAR